MTFKTFGIGVKFVSETAPEAFAAAIDEKTKAVYVEIISNPMYLLSDIPALAKVRLVYNSINRKRQFCIGGP